jgi:hypothetical protein
MHQNSLLCTPILEFLKSTGFEPKQSKAVVIKKLDAILSWIVQLARRGPSYRHHAVKLHFNLRNCSDSQLAVGQRFIGDHEQMTFM